MYAYGISFVPVNLLFLSLGALLLIFASQSGLALPEKSDDILPFFAAEGRLGIVTMIFFTIGIVAAAFSSADSALTALTTSFCIDILGVERTNKQDAEKARKWVHFFISVVFIGFILLFKAANNDSIIDAIYTIASYTYGPLLGLFAFGLFTQMRPRDKFVPWVAQTVISWPDLKKRGAKLTRTNMEALDGKPYLLLINHASKVDLNMMYKATHPQPLVNVMTIEGFRDFTLPLMDLLGVIGKRKFIQDLNLIKNIKYTIKELGAIFVLFPESRYSLDGTTSYITPSVGALVHMIKVPVAVLTLHGNFVTHPQWNKKNKHTYVEGEIRPIVLPDEAESVSADEVNRRIAEAFVYDDYKWQYENKVVIDDPDRAKPPLRQGIRDRFRRHGALVQCLRCALGAGRIRQTSRHRRRRDGL